LSDVFEYSTAIELGDDVLAGCVEFAGEAARAAGAAVLPYFRQSVLIENKLSNGGFDPVTEADKAAEQIIRAQISKAFPDHGILGEEFGYQKGNGLTWVIDPIDGTKAFMTGMLHWGVLLGLFNGQHPIGGVMYQPYTDELFAGDGTTASLEHRGNKRELRGSACRSLSDAVMATTGPSWFEGAVLTQFEALRAATKMCRLGGDCYLFAMVAMGYLDLAVESSLNPYDIQALIPIIEGAGGVVTTFDGQDASMGGSVIASANPVLHEAALELVAKN